MANTKHAIVNTSKIRGTENCADIFSVLVYDAHGTQKIDCDNGTVVTLGGTKMLDTTIPTTNIEVYKATLPDVADRENLVMVVNPELIYDETIKHPLSDYYNKAGQVVRAFNMHRDDIFGLTAEAFTTPTAVEVGKWVTVGGTGKLVINDTKPTGSEVVLGYIEQALVYDYETFYQLRIY